MRRCATYIQCGEAPCFPSLRPLRGTFVLDVRRQMLHGRITPISMLVISCGLLGFDGLLSPTRCRLWFVLSRPQTILMSQAAHRNRQRSSNSWLRFRWYQSRTSRKVLRDLPRVQRCNSPKTQTKPLRKGQATLETAKFSSCPITKPPHSGPIIDSADSGSLFQGPGALPHNEAASTPVSKGHNHEGCVALSLGSVEVVEERRGLALGRGRRHRK
jgi:hypothetical protein